MFGRPRFTPEQIQRWAEDAELERLRLPGLRVLAEQLNTLLQGHGFQEAETLLPGASKEDWSPLTRNGVQIEFVPMPRRGTSGVLRVDIHLDTIGPETALFQKVSCGNLEFLATREYFEATHENVGETISHILALTPPGEHLVSKYGRIL